MRWFIFIPRPTRPVARRRRAVFATTFVELQARDVQVIGVSSDSPDAQRRFKEKYRLPFTLLADRERAVAQAFGVPLMLGLTRRQSFLIKDGHVVWRDLHAATKEQARDLLRFLHKKILPPS